MFKPKGIHSIIDYRNARYQGHVGDQGNRNQLGVLIDDDLSFYVSHWSQNRLNGQTLVYISHGKYIYGEWTNNQPNGLNVFRTGDTVLVGEFRNGEIIGKILVIFQKYNIIAVLQTKSSKQKFQVFECGKLVSHDDLLKYIQMLDIQMPEHSFSLIKFVTSLTNSQQNDHQQSLIASPCEGQNCYFGYRQGLAIVFNSNNGVVSVGHHQSKQICGYGGKFDENKIQEGNFDMKQTIVYHKERPINQVYAIFQKMHKRSLNFKNQYFDSKVKTFGDLQSILRGNIQKIVNYNMKNKIHEATVGDLNDSLDYQNMDEYQSQKTSQNRQTMYGKQTSNIKNATSQYYKQEMKNKATSRITGSNTKQAQKSHSKISVSSNLDLSKDQQQTTRRTPNKRKQSVVYYAKKSPIRFNQEDGQLYSKQSRSRINYGQTSQCYEQKQKKGYTNHKPYERNASRSPINHPKNTQNKNVANDYKDNKIPKFGGLELQQIQEKIPKKNIQFQVQQYKKQLQKSRSKDKLSGHSILKCLKRPNYEDIQERRKRLLSQFKQLTDSNSNSRLSNISQGKRKVHKQSIQIQINLNLGRDNQRQSNVSLYTKQKILPYTSQSENGTQNSGQGCIPLSLITNLKGRNKRVENGSSKIGSAFYKKQSFAQKIDTDQMRNGKQNLQIINGKQILSIRNEKQNVKLTLSSKQNLSYTPSSFVKHKKDLQNLDLESHGKYTGVNKVSYRDNEEGLPLINLLKKSQSQHMISENQQDDYNHFSQINLRHQTSDRMGNVDIRNIKMGQRQENNRQRPNMRDEGKRMVVQRDRSPLTTDIPRRKSYKYYFQQ